MPAASTLAPSRPRQGHDRRQIQVESTPIHPSLVRPILLAGGERELVLINLVAIFALVLGVGPHPASLGLAAVLATVGHAALVRLAAYDPQGWRVFARHFRYRDVYPAGAHPLAPTRVVQPFPVR